MYTRTKVDNIFDASSEDDPAVSVSPRFEMLLYTDGTSSRTLVKRKTRSRRGQKRGPHKRQSSKIVRMGDMETKA